MAVAILAAALPGCTIVDQVEVFNNSGTGIEVRGCGRTERVGDGLTITLNALCRPPIVVDSSLGQWTYRGLTDRDLIRRVGAQTPVGYYLLKLQLQSDGTVIVVARDARYPLKSVASQPPGFPLRPS